MGSLRRFLNRPRLVRRRWLVPGLGVSLATLLVAAACGGDSDDEAEADSTPSPQATSPSQATPDGGNGDESPSGGETPGGESPGTDVSSGEPRPVMTAPAVQSSSSPAPSSVTFICTLVIGFSQTRQWYEPAGAFESNVGTDHWQLLWAGGAGVDRWRNANYEGWAREVASPCSQNKDSPDRVILTISGPYGSNEEAWAQAISETAALVRTNFPSVLQIILQSIVGGPNHMDCPIPGGQRVRASWQHAHIDNAILAVVDGDMIAGSSPEVRSCDDYADEIGHLTPEGAVAAGHAIAEFYR